MSYTDITRAMACSVYILIISCADTANLQEPKADANEPAGSLAKADHATLPPSLSQTGIGTLPFTDLRTPSGTFGGIPLMVSNNPEHVYGFGLLASSAPPEIHGQSSRAPGAPSPELIWLRNDDWLSQQTECSRGEAQALQLYLAHILDHAMGADRRLSLVIEAGQGRSVEVEWSVSLGTTEWSDWRGIKTRRKNWLGARIARSRMENELSGDERTHRIKLARGQRKIIKTVRASSLVEGIAKIKAVEGCFKLHVVAHPPNQAIEYLHEYAEGDVKWPGWFNGQGYGRAAGIFEGSQWHVAEEMEINQATQSFGWTLLDAGSSPAALARHGDSSDILFGGYGMVYTFETTITNSAQSCRSVVPHFTSYARFASDDPHYSDAARTPSWRTLAMNRPDSFPTMVWNGPLRVEYDLRGGDRAIHKEDIVLSVDIAGDERANPDRAIASLSKRLFRMDLNPREVRHLKFTFVVPGYIVAPIAIAFETHRCDS